MDKKEHGTKISGQLKSIISLDVKQIIDLIGSKFVVDPDFEIYVNDEKIIISKLEHLRDEFVVETSYGDVKIELYYTTKRGRTANQNGIAWWVHNRLVGIASWKITSSGEKLDKRFKLARLYTFVVNADILEDDVKEDWSGFKDSSRFNIVEQAVAEEILKKMQIIFAGERFKTKKEILNKYVKEIRDLPVLTRDKIGTFMNQIQIKCPSLRDYDLDNLIKILINLETSVSKYDLLDNLSKINSTELDDLNEIVSKWSIREAKIVLNALYWRLKLVKKLQELVEKKCDELHDLQPIFDTGLWMFGPEYDPVQFTSNQTLTSVIRKFFNKKYNNILPQRPDFVALPNSSIGIYTAEDGDEGDMLKIRKVLIVELKRGQHKILGEDVNQAKKYAQMLKAEGHISDDVKIIVYVLGSSLSEYATDEKLDKKGIFIYPKTYNSILITNHKRLFNLLKKIKLVKKIKDEDIQIAELMKQKSLDEVVS